MWRQIRASTTFHFFFLFTLACCILLAGLLNNQVKSRANIILIKFSTENKRNCCKIKKKSRKLELLGYCIRTMTMSW